MSFRETGFGPGNISDLAVYTRAEYIQNNLVDIVSGKSNMVKFFAKSDVNSAFRERMNLAPREMPFLEGPQIEVPILDNLGSIEFIHGASTLNTTAPRNSTLARYEWKEMVGPAMALTRRDILLNQGSRTQIMNLARLQADNSMKAVIEDLETHLGGSASGYEILGFQDLVEDSPTSTIGEINRTTTAQWQNYADATAIANFATNDAGFKAAETMYTAIRRGMEKPDVWFTTPDIQRFWTQYLVIKGTWNTFENSAIEADIGRDVPWYHGAPIVASDGVAANHLYGLNTQTIFLTFMQGQQFVETGTVRAFNSLQTVNWIYAMLAFIITNPARNGVITDIQDY